VEILERSDGMTDLTVDSAASTRRSRGAALFALTAVAALAPTAYWVGRDVAALDRLRGTTPHLLAAAAPEWRAPSPTVLRAPEDGLRSVSFRLLAPAAQSVWVGGSFNDFNAADHPLTRTSEGVWETTVRLAPGRYEYKFKVDGRWELDPANPERTPAPRECSLLEIGS
jgi:hypothetical protein